MLEKKIRVGILLSIFLLVTMSGCGSHKRNSADSKEDKTKESTMYTSEVINSSENTSVESLVEQETKDSVIRPVQRRYSFDEKISISNEFIEWASERAKIGGVAINGTYFNHGASG